MNTINILHQNLTIFLTLTGILGLIVGSFLNVVIYRLPIMLKADWHQECIDYLKDVMPEKNRVINLLTPRSHCPKCKTDIPAWCNIPLISFLLLKRKCRHCGAKISWRYPLVELLSCISSIWVAHHFGVSWQTAAVLPLTWALIAAIFIDLDHQLLPDNITLPLLWIGLLLSLFKIFVTPENAIIGATAGYLSLWVIAYVFKLIRNVQGMGHGDFKLFALFGAWLGWEILPLIILAASLAGCIVGITLIICKKQRYQQPMPFGPFLAAAGWLAFFFGQDILHWYVTFMIK